MRKTEYQEANIDEVMQYFIKGFDQLPTGTTVQEWFYDPYQGKVVFKFYTEDLTPDKNVE